MAKKIRYGMVGGSMKAFIGDVHRKAIAFDPRAELAAGCFSTREPLNRETGEIYGLDPERVYADYETMAKAEAAREDGIDFVSIVSPNYLHYPVAKAFLEAGIHVMCEKPLCFRVEEAEELKRMAEERGLLFGVTHTYTGYCMARVAREMIAEGKIGNIIAVNAEYAQDWMLKTLDPEYAPDPEAEAMRPVWRVNPEYTGAANCVGDIGTHIENFVHFITGLKIRRLLATTNTFGRALDMNANMILEYDNGATGAYWCSQVAAGHCNGLVVRVFGDKGSVEWAQEDPEVIRYAPAKGPLQILKRNTAAVTEPANAFSRIPAGHPEGLYVAFANIYRDFISALIDRQAGRDASGYLFPTAEDGLNGVKFISAVVESAANNSKWVEL